MLNNIGVAVSEDPNGGDGWGSFVATSAINVSFAAIGGTYDLNTLGTATNNSFPFLSILLTAFQLDPILRSICLH